MIRDWGLHYSDKNTIQLNYILDNDCTVEQSNSIICVVEETGCLKVTDSSGRVYTIEDNSQSRKEVLLDLYKWPLPDYSFIEFVIKYSPHFKKIKRRNIIKNLFKRKDDTFIRVDMVFYLKLRKLIEYWFFSVAISNSIFGVHIGSENYHNSDFSYTAKRLFFNIFRINKKKIDKCIYQSVLDIYFRNVYDSTRDQDFVTKNYIIKQDIIVDNIDVGVRFVDIKWIGRLPNRNI